MIKLAGAIADYGIKIMYDLIMDNPYDTEETLKDTVEFLFQLPKPLCFSLFSLQYFPDYPLTKKAIGDGHILPEKASTDNLIESTPRNYLFVPKLFPYTDKQILQNIIWSIVSNHAKDATVKYAVFGNTFGSRLCLTWLNFKSIFLGKIFGVGGIISRNYWITCLTVGIGYILKGDLKTLYLKLKKYIKLLWFSH